MDEDEFYNNLEALIEESKRQVYLERVLETIQEKSKKYPCYNYTSLVIPSDSSSENGYGTSNDIGEMLHLHKDDEMDALKQRLSERKGRRRTGGNEKCRKVNERTWSCERNKQLTKKTNRENTKRSRKNRGNIRDFINLEKEIFIARTLMYKKKGKLDDIYDYINRKEKIIGNLNKNMHRESARFQESLVQNFKRTEDLIRKFEEISARKRKRKNQAQLLNIEISKLDVELEKKEEKIKELDKYKKFLNKLASSDKLEDNPTDNTDKWVGQNGGEDYEKGGKDGKDGKDEKDGKDGKDGDEDGDNFTKKMQKYINNSQLLIDSFNLLEENHLQLIDDTQNAEYELEENEKKYEEKKKNIVTKHNEIDIKIEKVYNTIKQYKGKITEHELALKNCKEHISFENINNKIDYICNQFSYDMNSNEIMKKLQIVENKIYSYIAILTKYTEENSQLVYAYQREREQERRKQMRFEINLDRKGNKQNRQSKKANNKALAANLKDSSPYALLSVHKHPKIGSTTNFGKITSPKFQLMQSSAMQQIYI
ncbi:hypothetical protein, conserved [Plasmodium ovale curtisi]|uniref:DUF4200 domain-containing protein n=1 Tax=Plasmodium ovale curtisi TaxID=864141 RepID=A0A1A8VYR4_PLAOA|nr:hypothetical protein, conserved [Plasmodium ovale curtisi]